MLFVRGMLIGFVVSAPIGPVGIICIRNALRHSQFAALAAGLGAALADTFYGAVIGLGFSAISHFLNTHQVSLTCVGAAIMMVAGIKIWRAGRVAVDLADCRPPQIWPDFVSSFLMTLTNPGTVLGVMGVFAATAFIAHPQGLAQSWVLLAGIFAGALLWWLVLSSTALAARTLFTPKRMQLLNRFSGALLLGFAVVALVGLALSYSGVRF